MRISSIRANELLASIRFRPLCIISSWGSGGNPLEFLYQKVFRKRHLASKTFAQTWLLQNLNLCSKRRLWFFCEHMFALDLILLKILYLNFKRRYFIVQRLILTKLLLLAYLKSHQPYHAEACTCPTEQVAIARNLVPGMFLGGKALGNSGCWWHKI